MKKLVVIFLIIVLSASILSAVFISTNNSTTQHTLCFNSNGKFTVVQFADFHEWAGIEEQDGSITPQNGIKPALAAYIISVIDSVQPDFIVLTGDNIFNLSWQDFILKISSRTMAYIADIFEQKQVYWTFTFGNHDTEGAATKQEYIQSVANYRYFVGGLEDGKDYTTLAYQAADDDYRAGNYSIPIYSRRNNAVAYNIFVLDSGSYAYAPPSSVPYRYILDAQTDWYNQQASQLKALNGGKAVPSLIFTHIPLLEHKEAYLQNNTHIGVWAGISPSNTRSTLFAASLNNGDARAIFTGHNHNNSYTGFYVSGKQKIMMGITPQAEATSYTANSATMYSRVITLHRDGNLSTYIHTSDTSLYPDGVYRGEKLSFN